MHWVGTTRVPATGPYMIGRFVPGRRGEIDLVRNPTFREWSAAAQPAGLPDRIVWRFGLSPAQEAAAIEAGRADWMIPDDRVPRISTVSARYPGQVHVNPQLGTAYVAFNTTVPPFNDVRVRRAVSFAADRTKAAAALGGQDYARPTCQIIPPGLPGYRPYCPDTADPGRSGAWIGSDLGRARRLVAASHTRGMRVVVWGHEGDHRLGGYVVGVLRQLGYHASLHLASDTAFGLNVDDTRRKVQASVAQWVVDFPSPSDIFDLFYRCSTFKPADPADTTSSFFYCDHHIDRQMTQADRLQITDPARAATTWARVDREFTNRALSVQFVSINETDFTSARVHNYQYNPAYGIGIMLDQLRVR
jgi:peptide/nickel transport system substrate-binding protein